MVPGSLLGDNDNVCHFAIKKNLNENDDTIYVGNMFLRNHYVFFDMSPIDERNDQYLLVGIGDRNPKDVIGESHYNPNTN